MTFIYVSGAGTHSTGKKRTMWARVKGQTENAVLRLPFKGAYIFRPGVIVPLHGIASRTRAYRIGYMLAKPFVPLLQRLFPQSITTTEQIGRAMLRVAREGYRRRCLRRGTSAGSDPSCCIHGASSGYDCIPAMTPRRRKPPQVVYFKGRGMDRKW